MITAVLLAAGSSSRLGRPKQVLPFRGRPLAQHAVDAAERAGVDEIVVVLGHRANEVAGALRLPPIARPVVNPEYGEGQSSSLRAGLRAAHPAALAAVVLLADQPSVRPEAIVTVTRAYGRGAGPVVQATYGGRPGHPVLLDRSVWPEVDAVRGDIGARDLLAHHPEWVVEVEVEGEVPPDVDTWEDYERLTGGAGA